MSAVAARVVIDPVVVSVQTDDGSMVQQSMGFIELVEHARQLAGVARSAKREYRAAMIELGRFIEEVRATLPNGPFGEWMSHAALHGSTVRRARNWFKMSRLKGAAQAEEITRPVAARKVEIDDMDLAMDAGDPDFLEKLDSDSKGPDAGTSNKDFCGIDRQWTGSVRVSEEVSKVEQSDFAVIGADVVPPAAGSRLSIVGTESQLVSPVTPIRQPRSAAPQQLLLAEIFEAQREAREAMSFISGWLSGPDVQRSPVAVRRMVDEIRAFRARIERVADGSAAPATAGGA